MESLLKLVLMFLGSSITFWLGEWDTLIHYLIIFIVLDYLSGIVSAIKNKRLSSNVGWKGLLKKITIFIVIGIAHSIDSLLMQHPINSFHVDLFPPLRTLVIWGYIINEVISILDNISKSGIYLPPILRKVMEYIHSKSQNGFDDKRD